MRHLMANGESDSPARMGRPPLNLDKTVIRLSAETRSRIEALVGKRAMAAFIREAVERELLRREKGQHPKAKGK
jgi:hypothetical protein